MIKNNRKQNPHVEKNRNENYVAKTTTSIWQEIPSSQNPYLPTKQLCYGYDMSQLIAKRSFVDVLFLMFRGELPSKEQALLLERLMVAYINPGPRHPATQAAMNCGVSRSRYSNILPIASAVGGGQHLGGGEVEKAMRFLIKHVNDSPTDVAQQCAAKHSSLEDNSQRIAPGFGTHFGGIDHLQQKRVTEITAELKPGLFFQWANTFCQAIAQHKQGWIETGVIAVTLCELGFQPREGAGIYQIISAPGLFAHGIEMATKPLTSMPFLSDEQYIIEENHDAR